MHAARAYEAAKELERSRVMNIPRLRSSRREFNQFCATIGLGLVAVSSLIRPTGAQNAEGASEDRARTVKFRDGTTVPAVGQGSAGLAQGRHPAAAEEEALRSGISLGMTVIDTSEGYGGGRSEELIGRVIAGQRERVFLVSKVDRTEGNYIARACQTSLDRMSTDYLDLYLLHWRNPEDDLSHVVASFEALRAARKIRAWGVSNFKVGDMEDLFCVPGGDRCATNQVRYSLNSRRIEDDILPWCEQHGMPIMAYTPLGEGLVHDALLTRIGTAHNCSAAAVALAWIIRSGNVIAIPESGSTAHVKENAVALSLRLTPDDIQALDAAFPMSSEDKLRVLIDRIRLWVHRSCK
jgi:diketogulonate reductase-like aldo/keto reductase